MVQTLTFKGSFKLPSTSTSLPTKQILGPVYLTSIALFRNFFCKFMVYKFKRRPYFPTLCFSALIGTALWWSSGFKTIITNDGKIATPHVRKFNNQLLKNSKIAMFRLLHSYNFTWINIKLNLINNGQFQFIIVLLWN